MVWQKDFPASSANLGPGFDSIGIAVDRYLTVTARPAERWQVDFETDFMAGLPQDETNLVVAVALETAARYGKTLAHLHLTMKSQIPLTHGMGSSASAIVAGIELANDFADLGLSTFDKVRLASAKEGHPDNVAPAIFGGFTISVVTRGRVECFSLMPRMPLKLVVAVPEFPLSTKLARSVLPEQVNMKDAVYNVSRAALLAAALTKGQPRFLRNAFADALHQPYREKLIPGMKDVFRAARRSGALGASLSGAGPCLIAYTLENEEAVGQAMVEAFAKHEVEARALQLSLDAHGARVLKQR